MRKASRFNDLVQARIEGLLPPKYISKLEAKDIAIACGVKTSEIIQPPNIFRRPRTT